MKPRISASRLKPTVKAALIIVPRAACCRSVRPCSSMFRVGCAVLVTAPQGSRRFSPARCQRGTAVHTGGPHAVGIALSPRRDGRRLRPTRRNRALRPPAGRRARRRTYFLPRWHPRGPWRRPHSRAAPWAARAVAAARRGPRRRRGGPLAPALLHPWARAGPDRLVRVVGPPRAAAARHVRRARARSAVRRAFRGGRAALGVAAR